MHNQFQFNGLATLDSVLIFFFWQPFSVRKSNVLGKRLAKKFTFFEINLRAMSVKMKVWTVLDIALRVPPIFLMDKALKYEFRTNVDDTHSELASQIFFNNVTADYFVRPWITAHVLEDYGFTLLEILLYIQGL